MLAQRSHFRILPLSSLRAAVAQDFAASPRRGPCGPGAASSLNLSLRTPPPSSGRRRRHHRPVRTGPSRRPGSQHVLEPESDPLLLHLHLPRYRMTRAVREYGLQQLRETGVLAIAAERRWSQCRHPVTTAQAVGPGPLSVLAFWSTTSRTPPTRCCWGRAGAALEFLIDACDQPPKSRSGTGRKMPHRSLEVITGISHPGRCELGGVQVASRLVKSSLETRERMGDHVGPHLLASTRRIAARVRAETLRTLRTEHCHRGRHRSAWTDLGRLRGIALSDQHEASCHGSSRESPAITASGPAEGGARSR